MKAYSTPVWIFSHLVCSMWRAVPQTLISTLAISSSSLSKTINWLLWKSFFPSPNHLCNACRTALFSSTDQQINRWLMSSKNFLASSLHFRIIPNMSPWSFFCRFSISLWRRSSTIGSFVASLYYCRPTPPFALSSIINDGSVRLGSRVALQFDFFLTNSLGNLCTLSTWVVPLSSWTGLESKELLVK